MATSGLFVPSAIVVATTLVAMGVLVLTWLTLRPHVAALTNARTYGIAAAWALPLVVARPLFSGDVWSYLAQGLTAAGGLDPYRLGPAQALGSASVVTQHVSHYWVGTPAPYGPAWLTMSRAVALVAGDRLTASVLLYRLLALAGVVLIAWALPRLARRVGASPTGALWLGLLNPLVLWHLVAGAHNDAIMLGLMLAGMELALAGLSGAAMPGWLRFAAGAAGWLRFAGGAAGWLRFAAGAALLTVAANIKVVAAAAVCCLAAAIARRHPRAAVALLAGAAAGTVLLSTVAGFGWLPALRGSTTVYSWMAPTTAIGLLIGVVVGTHVTATAVAIANVVGAVICAPVVVRLLAAVYRGRIDPLRGLGLIFVAAVLCGPVVQPWYLLWAVLPLAASARGRRERSAVAAVSAVVAMLVPPFASGVAALVVGYLIAAAVLGAALLTLGQWPEWTDGMIRIGGRQRGVRDHIRRGTSKIPLPQARILPTLFFTSKTNFRNGKEPSMSWYPSIDLQRAALRDEVAMPLGGRPAIQHENQRSDLGSGRYRR
ncbi:polyprenol phosphomannose-dependent alpha 1,6 mannosyltransferase MptB [Krasilnikovia cinnamomea]|uniref:polyprenol phosphomannose-dependent alpha 1,6 mannosyltransferase MptB n=1 Tax=Krasilnikovia cinnamomea TaxID=349313 RepID=UPI00102BD501|nr:polyprenol phosphomannose-dependent alpha 1,6 mannosyltransferase MptB [Krasilnikovia cinnamomea]